jgi:hypothetical protein
MCFVDQVYAKNIFKDVNKASAFYRVFYFDTDLCH